MKKEVVYISIFLFIIFLIIFLRLFVFTNNLQMNETHPETINNSSSLSNKSTTINNSKRSNVIPYFSDGFENYTSGVAIPEGSGHGGFTWGNNGYNAGDVKVSWNYSHSGNKSLMFIFPAVPDGTDDWTQEGFYLSQNDTSAPKAVWIDYYLRIPNNFELRNDSPNNNKLLLIWADKYSSDNNTLLDIEYEGNNSDIISHINEYPHNTGDHNIFRAPYLFDQSYLGKWVHVQVYARVGNASVNGTWEGWINGNLKWRMTNHSLYAPGGNNYWRQGYLMGWANSGFTNTTEFYIDDFKVYTQNPGWNLPS